MRLTDIRTSPALAAARRLVAGLSSAGLALGTLFLALSLTPSLLPRSVEFQGLVSGLSLTLGYALGRTGSWLWSYLGFAAPDARLRRIATLAVAAICAVVGALFLFHATGWQNSVRATMGMEEVSGVRPVSVASIALLVFGSLYLIAWLFRRAARFVKRRLPHVVPRRVAVLVGVIAAGVVFWTIANGVVFAFALRVTDGSFRQLDALIDDELVQPASAARSGSPQSLITWSDLGHQGRSFVSSGPSAAEIGDFHGEEAIEPIRVYAGLSSEESAHERARLALRDLIRAGGFERSVLLLVTPTGTGWIDPASLDPVEYIHRGDIATVAAQYSYLPSPLALLTDAPSGAETAHALFREVYGYWSGMPKEDRPKLYLHGVSLGALNADLSFDLYDILPDPFEGALWAGPPFRSRSWSRITATRDPGSPAWLPRFRDGSVVRFANQNGGLEVGQAAWGPLRIAYLQYASDPVTFFSVSSVFRKPEWLRKPRGPDVAPELRWYPVVTMVQLAADIAAGVEATPIGYGHNYAPAHYIDAWVALTQPAGWTDADTERLKARFASYGR